MLREETLFGTVDKVDNAIQLLRDLEPGEGYYLAFSGGKDSIVIMELAQMAGVVFDAHYNNTTIDPPELVKFIREHHPNVKFENPDKAFVWRLAENGFPQRQRRWCCAEYKERGGENRVVITGIRAAESAKRAQRRQVEICYRGSGKRYVNPILTWTDDDVWQFIKVHDLAYCGLYDEGWKRIGCLFCPNAGTKHRVLEAEKYPGYTKLFIKAFQRLYDNKRDTWNLSRWNNGADMFWWWLGLNNDKEDPDQTVMFE